MATPNVGILTTAGKALIDKVNSGQAKISFSKVVFSSMDNSQLSDTQIKALTAIVPQEVVVSSPETTLDINSGETRIRATGTNEKLADGVYVKTYGVFAKDDTDNEILYGVTVSPNPNYFPAYDGVTPQAVTYSYKTVIQETSNITMTNSNDVYVSQEDLTEAIAKIPKPDLGNYATKDEVATKVDTSAIDPSVMVKSTLTANDDVLTLDPGTYWVWGKAPKNYPTSVPWGTVVVKLNSISTSGNNRLVEVTDVSRNQLINTYSGVPVTWSGWQVPNASAMASKSDVTTAVSTATANMADTTKPTNFTDGLQSGGVDVATAADLKSLEDASWHQIALPDQQASKNLSLLYKVDRVNKQLKINLSGTFVNYESAWGAGIVIADFGDIITGITSVDAYITFVKRFIDDTNANFTAWDSGGAHKQGVDTEIYFSGSKLLIKCSDASINNGYGRLNVPGGEDFAMVNDTITYKELVQK